MSDIDKILNETLKSLNKEFGEGSIMELSKMGDIDVEAVSTNCFALDNILGCGGLPRGRIIEIYGQESSGKSSLALHLVSQIQKAGGRAMWVDAEFAFSKKYAEGLGVDVKKLILSQPSYGEEGLKMVQQMVKTNAVDIIVVDSVTALVPKKELEGEIIDAEMAQLARMMSKALRVLTGDISKSKTVVIFINQTREKIGIFYGKKITTPGGKALKFYASVRLEVKKGKNILDKKNEMIGTWMNIAVTKNKVGIPFKECDVELLYQGGIDLNGDLLDGALADGIVKKDGNTYFYDKQKLGVGREQAKEYMSGNQELFKKIKDEVKNLCK